MNQWVFFYDSSSKNNSKVQKKKKLIKKKLLLYKYLKLEANYVHLEKEKKIP